MTFKITVLSTTPSPAYISDVVLPYVPARNLRATDENLLTVSTVPPD